MGCRKNSFRCSPLYEKGGKGGFRACRDNKFPSIPLFQRGRSRTAVKLTAFILLVLLIFASAATAQEKKLEALNIAYTSATPTRSPLWIAKEVGLFEKYGIDAKLIYIRAGSPSISALVSGDMHVSSDPAAAAAIAAARGAPIVVVGTYGLASYRLVAHPAIASIRNLKGRSIGSVRPGSGPDALLHRFLPKLGLVPGVT
jgi:ABC-type nitrate/sulfonate/bicarbonate transport system substrate-binding protein